jgi:hypothetical protein
VAADEFDMESLDIPELSTPAAQPVTAPEKTADAGAQKAPRPSKPVPQRAPTAVETELGLVTPPTAGPPLWRVTESIEDFYGGGEEVTTPVDAVPMPQVAETATPIRMPAPAVRTAPRPRRTPPNPDDWSYFDPSQGPFKALIKRLDEIAGTAA